MLTPFERYQKAVLSGESIADEKQACVIQHLQALHHEIQHLDSSSWFKLGKKPKLKGLYLWGSVGAGKTWLMDLFFESLPLKKKQRLHFHDFMREIHAQLEHYQGTQNPLEKIGTLYARQIRVLCLDEFLVSDIGDAMILSQLLEALFKQRILLVATSNTPPEDLYKNGLQRGRFLPAIQYIKKNMDILSLHPQRDYRLRTLEDAGVFFHPHNSTQFEQLFLNLAQGKIHHEKDIYLYDRPIETVAYSDNIIWLNFPKLCHIPRSQMDYLSIAKRWKIIMIDNVTEIPENKISTAKYFITLIDILYDYNILLIINSHISLERIYPQGELSTEFQRTQSRLQEMQSQEYILRTGIALNNL